MISSKLLEVLHQSRYTYINDEVKEVYVWHGTNEIMIYNYLGENLGKFNIVNYLEDRVYKKYEPINNRDVTISIDDIVHSTFKKTDE